MKKLLPLRVVAGIAALGAAFVSGWVLHSTQSPELPVANRIPQSPGPKPGISSGTAKEDRAARVPPTSGAVGRAVEIESLDARGALAALRALDLPGAPAGSVIEKHLLLARFASVDPETALSYVDTLPAGERSDAAATVMGAWAEKDPRAAAAHLTEEAGGLGLSETATVSGASAVAGEWSRRDPQAAAAWAAELPDEFRAGALAAAVGRYAAADSAAALRFFTSLPDSAIRAEAATPLAAQWASTDSTAAAAWASSISSAAEQSAALSGVTSAWMSNDPAAASRWVKTLPAGPGKDAAIISLAAAPSIRNDPEAALAWAESISSSEVKEQVVAGIRDRLRIRESIP